MSGLSLITKGMLIDRGSITYYNVLPFDLSIDTVDKKLNLKVNEIKKCNILKINTKTFNIEVLDKNINIVKEDKKINIQRS